MSREKDTYNCAPKAKRAPGGVHCEQRVGLGILVFLRGPRGEKQKVKDQRTRTKHVTAPTCMQKSAGAPTETRKKMRLVRDVALGRAFDSKKRLEFLPFTVCEPGRQVSSASLRPGATDAHPSPHL